jgi:hypothetical protein
MKAAQQMEEDIWKPCINYGLISKIYKNSQYSVAQILILKIGK